MDRIHDIYESFHVCLFEMHLASYILVGVALLTFVWSLATRSQFVKEWCQVIGFVAISVAVIIENPYILVFWIPLGIIYVLGSFMK